MAPTTIPTLIRYDVPETGVARVTLARPQKQNAINPAMIFELNEAFNKALYDDTIKVIVLAADGKNFSAGHDISETVEQYTRSVRKPAAKGRHLERV